MCPRTSRHFPTSGRFGAIPARLMVIANLSEADEDIIVRSESGLIPTNIPRGRTLLCRNDSLSNVTIWMTAGYGLARITLIDEETSL